jgi:hypothetical protein
MYTVKSTKEGVHGEKYQQREYTKECQKKEYTGKSPTSKGSTMGEVTTEGVHREEYQQMGDMGRSIRRGSTREKNWQRVHEEENYQQKMQGEEV